MIHFFVIFLISIFGTDAKDIKISTEKSKIVWSCSKIIGSTHTGVISLKEGTLKMEGEKLIGGSFVIDMGSISNTDLSGDSKSNLEKHLKSNDFFNVEKFPTATFVIKNIKSMGSRKYTIAGDVEIKDIKKTLSFDATVSRKKDKYEVTAKMTVDRTQFNVRYGSGSFFDNLGDRAISDDFTLEMNLVTNEL